MPTAQFHASLRDNSATFSIFKLQTGMGTDLKENL